MLPRPQTPNLSLRRNADRVALTRADAARSRDARSAPARPRLGNTRARASTRLAALETMMDAPPSLSGLHRGVWVLRWSLEAVSTEDPAPEEARQIMMCVKDGAAAIRAWWNTHGPVTQVPAMERAVAALAPTPVCSLFHLSKWLDRVLWRLLGFNSRPSTLDPVSRSFDRAYHDVITGLHASDHRGRAKVLRDFAAALRAGGEDGCPFQLSESTQLVRAVWRWAHALGLATLTPISADIAASIATTCSSLEADPIGSVERLAVLVVDWAYEFDAIAGSSHGLDLAAAQASESLDPRHRLHSGTYGATVLPFPLPAPHR